MNDISDALRYVVDDPKGGLFQVNRVAYSSPEILQMEIERIFSRCWLYLGHESEIPQPNDFITRTLLGRPLMMVRDSDGEIRVFINSCMHRGAELARAERGNSRLFACFYHAWTYNTKGELVSVPDRAGYPPSFEQEKIRLQAPRTAVYRGFVFISFNPDVVDLETYLGGARYYIDLVADHSAKGMEVVSGEHRYPIAANWKLLVENSIDGYHLIPLHATYFDYLRSSGNEVKTRRPTQALDLGQGHALIIDEAPWGRPTARWRPSLGEDVREEIEARRAELTQRLGAERAEQVANTDRNLLVFPNLVINDIMAVTVRTIWPVAPGRMDVTAWSLAPKDDSPKLRSATLTNFISFLGPGGFATPDDIEALESIQRTMGARGEIPWSDMSRGVAQREPNTSAQEEQARAFWKHWNHLIMTGE
jgi:phenylpropionate dioxygenase-like ring-hydroxylating dioxygenase large terminal subunit